MIDKILLAVDGSLNAQRAVDLAGELAGKLGAEMCIVHVLMHGRPSEEMLHMAEVEHLVKAVQTAVSPANASAAGSFPSLLGGNRMDPKTERIISVLGEQILSRAQKHCAEQGAPNVKTSLRAGDYAEEILTAATEFRADLIVIGSRGLGLLQSTVLGSVSQKVLHHAGCSVLTVK